MSKALDDRMAELPPWPRAGQLLLTLIDGGQMTSQWMQGCS